MSFHVTVTPSGHSFAVEPDESLLDAALRQGLAFPYGCRNGACGSCRGRVTGGEVHYPAGTPTGISATESDRGYALLCHAHAGSDVSVEIEEIDSVRAIQVRTLPVRLAEKILLAHDVMLLRLQLPAGERLQYLAGQYIDVLLRDGRRRAFSLANAPVNDQLLELHVRLVARGAFSGYVFDELRERNLLRIHGPLGSFYLRKDREGPIVLVAGGTGFAPIKAMAEDLLREGTGREVHVYCGVRSVRDLYMDEMVQGWREQLPGLRYTPVLSDPLPEDEWQGRTGFVHEAVLADFSDLAAADVYASGPPAMISAVRDSFLARGADPERLHSDSFDYAHETGHDDESIV